MKGVYLTSNRRLKSSTSVIVFSMASASQPLPIRLQPIPDKLPNSHKRQCLTKLNSPKEAFPIQVAVGIGEELLGHNRFQRIRQDGCTWHRIDQSRKRQLLRVWGNHIAESHIHRNELLCRVEMSHERNAHAMVFLGDGNLARLYRVAVKRKAILWTVYLAYLTEYALDVLGIVADAPCHEVDVQSGTRLKPVMGIEQCATLQDKPVLVFADRQPVQQTFLEIA